MDFEKWKNHFFSEQIVDLKKYFDDKDFEILNKLKIEVKDKIYTESEFEQLYSKYLQYYLSNNAEDDELLNIKPLESTGVSREDYNKLLSKMEKINQDYNF